MVESPDVIADGPWYICPMGRWTHGSAAVDSSDDQAGVSVIAKRRIDGINQNVVRVAAPADFVEVLPPLGLPE
jgi:hypothetical protein